MAKLGPLKRHGDSTATSDDVQNAATRLSLCTPRRPRDRSCDPFVPFLHPTAWDTQWWAVGVTRERLGVYVTKIQYTTRICNKPLRAGSPFYIHEVIQGVLSSLIHVLFHAVLSVLYGCVQ